VPEVGADERVIADVRRRVQQACGVGRLPLTAPLLALFVDQITSAEQLGHPKLSGLEVAAVSAHDDVEDAVARRAGAARLVGFIIPAPISSAAVTGVRTIDMRPTLPPLDAERIKNFGFSTSHSRLYVVCLSELAHGRKRSQPAPASRPSGALAMVSAVMPHLAAGLGFVAVVRRGERLSPRPLGEDGEEAGDVLDDLPRVLPT
jgi:hypothetical protein